MVSVRKIIRIGGLALCLAAMVASCDSGAKTDTEYVESARKHLESGDVNAAVIELRNAIQQNAENPQARALLGQVYLSMGDGPGAAKELGRARALGVKDENLRVLLVRAWLLAGDFKSVLAEVPADLSLQTAATDSDLLAARGDALAGQGDIDQAKATYEKVVAKGPHAGALAGLARLSMVESDLPAAERYLSDGRKAFAEDMTLLTLQGELQLRKRQFSEAEATFQKAATGRPTNIRARTGLVRARIGLAKFDDASAEAEKLARERPDDLGVTLLQGVIALQKGEYQKARDQAERVLNAGNDNMPAVFIAGASSYALERYEEARRLLARYLAAVPGDLTARKILAASQLRLGQPADAATTLQASAESKDIDAQYLSLASTAALMSGNRQSGLAYLEQAVLQSPEDALLRARLGALRVSFGDDETATQDLEKALRQDPHLSGADVLLVAAQIKAGKFDEAIAGAKEIQSKRPDKAVGHVLEGIALARKADLSAASEAFRKALEIEPGDVSASANLASIKENSNDLNGAIELLTQALQIHPDNLLVLLRIASIEERRGNVDASEKWLEQAVKSNPKEHLPRILLAHLYLTTNRPDRALDIATPALQTDAQDPSLLETVGKAQQAVGRYREAVATFQDLARMRPSSPEPHFWAAQALAAVGDSAGTQRELELALQADPKHNLSRLALARLLLQQNQLEAAREQVAALKQALPDNPEVIGLEGVLLLADRKSAEAVAAFRRAFEISPNSTTALWLARGQWVAGDGSAGETTLKDWIAKSPNDPDVRAALGGYYASHGRLAEAREQYQRVTEISPNSGATRNDYAWILWRLGKIDEALIEAEKALELAPDNAAVQDTLGVILLEKGDLERSLPLLRQAAQGLPTNPSVKFHLARALAKKGDDEAARSILQEILKAPTGFEDRDAAQTLLDSLKS